MTDNQYETVIIADPDVENGTIYTPAKIRYYHALRLSAYLRANFTDWWSLSFNTNGGYIWYNLLDEKRNNLTGGLNLSTQFDLPGSWSPFLDLRANGGFIEGNMKTTGQWVVNVGVSKLLLKKKMTVALTIYDLFNTGGRYTTTTTALGYYSRYDTYRESRGIGLRLSYRFESGRKIMPKFIEKDYENTYRVK